MKLKKINIQKIKSTVTLIILKRYLKKVDYTMSSISGIQGLKPTVEIIKYWKNSNCKQRGNYMDGFNWKRVK